MTLTGRRAGARLGLAIDPDPLFADLIDAVRATAGDLGIEALDVLTAAQMAAVDDLLLIGRPGRYRSLLDERGRVAPRRIVWTGEPLPPLSTGPPERRFPAPDGSPSPLLRLARPVGSVLRRVPLPAPLDRQRVAMATNRLLIANLDELAMAAANGARLVVTSRDRGAVLAGHGFDAAVVPFGYHELHAGPLTPAIDGARDIGLLMLGTRATHTRRARQVDDLRRSGSGGGLTTAEGVWGSERAALLRRTRVLVDVHRIPGNFVGLRLLLSLAAGAALVTEPMTDPGPFIPGTHYLEAPASRLIDVATDLAADEVRRARLVDAGQALLRDELTMRASLEQVLAIRPGS